LAKSGRDLYEGEIPVERVGYYTQILADEASHYMFAEIGDGPANVEALAKEPDELFEQLGIDRNVDTFLKSGIFQRRLKNKDEIVNAWTEIRAGR
jgi:hypothetical protein